MIVGFTVFVLIGYNGFIDPARDGTVRDQPRLRLLARAAGVDRDRRRRLPALAGGGGAQRKAPGTV